MASLRRNTVAASVASVAVVLAGWAAVDAGNDDAGPQVAAVAVTREIPIEESALVAALPSAGSAAATRTSPVVRAVPLQALYRAPGCTKPAEATTAELATTRRAVRRAVNAIAVLGKDYPEAFAGQVPCTLAGRVTVFRMPQSSLDREIKEVAARENVTVRILRSAFSTDDVTAMSEWIDARKGVWAARGIIVRRVTVQPNGTLEVSVDSADVAAAAKKLEKFRAQVRVVPAVRR